MKLLDMERQLKGMRDGAINVKQRNADTNQMVIHTHTYTSGGTHTHICLHTHLDAFIYM
jgi:hypothetical protein